MRIVLTQTEIEEAIEKLILDQVAVPDDMRIDIDLKATRGEEGYQAFIDIVRHDAPTDGSDRSIDPRVTPLPGAETLDIAGKVAEAKQIAELPRRRGRPAGARNLPKHTETAEANKRPVTTGDDAPVENKADELISEAVVEEAPLEPTPEPQEAAVEATPSDPALDSPVAEDGVVEASEEDLQDALNAVQEPNGELDAAEPVAEPTAEPVAEATPVPEIFNEPDAPAPEVAEEEDVDYTPTPETKGFESNQAETEEVIPHVPAATVNETDVSDQVEAEPAQAEVPVAAQPTRSLFANLQRPNQG
jgi:hypothetical protein